MVEPVTSQPLMQNESQIVLYQPDDSIRLEVKIDAGNETVWLNRNQIAELFGRDVKTIGKHINNALREELVSETETNVSDVNKQNNPTVAKFATVQIEGGREVTRQVEYYNLDVILSVGYRVKSNRGIQFRRWSNTILKQYLLQGYSINRHLVAHTFSRLQMDKGIIMRSIISNQSSVISMSLPKKVDSLLLI